MTIGEFDVVMDRLRQQVQAMTLGDIDEALDGLGCQVTVLDPGGYNVICEDGGDRWPGFARFECGLCCDDLAIRHVHWRDGAGNWWGCEKHHRETCERDMPRWLFMHGYDLLGNERKEEAA